MTSPETWDARHREASEAPEPCAVLREQAAHLPQQGQALDLACGRGGNALWLARRGLHVDAWDRSAAGIEFLRAEAARQGLDIKADIRDVTLNPPEAESYDVVVVGFFLDRGLMPKLVNAVRAGGLLVYQTFMVGHPGPGPSNPDYLLQPGELEGFCGGWRILHTSERNGQVRLVAQR